MITQTELKEKLYYNPDTGEFIWKISTGRSKIGSVAGTKYNPKYPDAATLIRIDNKCYNAHRLVWLYMTGHWPEKHIDHIDHNPHNNKWNNLRAADVYQNLANKKKHSNNKSGYKGVYWCNVKKKYISEICHHYKKLYLGSFDNAIDAHNAYCVAANKLKGDFACSG